MLLNAQPSMWQAVQELSTFEEKQEALLDGLNPLQRAVALAIHGPVQAVAGAGAGKTKTFIVRCALMILSGIPAANIMMVTFTNKGAQEIKNRLEAMIGPDAQHVVTGTFHSVIFRNILKAYPEHPYLVNDLSLKMSECVILDEDESKSLFEDAIKLLDEPTAKMLNENSWKPRIKEEMNWARAHGMDVTRYEREKIGYGSKEDVLFRVTADVWRHYTRLCRASNGIDFDDILVVAKNLLQKDPTVAHELSQRYRYIQLDEYQDTNPVQAKIMDEIAKYHKNIFNVGDDKQSIYGFRNADITVITGFKDRYKDAKLMELNINYRSTPAILQAANVVATCMNQRITDGQLLTGRNPNEFAGQGEQVKLVSFENYEQEAEMIAAGIKRDVGKGVKGKDIAVIYRSRSVKQSLEKYLVKMGIDYEVVGDISFWQRAEVKDAIALLRMTYRPWDSRAVLRVVKNTTMGLSDNAVKKGMVEERMTASAFLEATAKKTKADGTPTTAAGKVGYLVESLRRIRQLDALGEDSEYIRKSIERIWETYLLPGVRKSADKAAEDADGENELENKMLNVTFLFDRFFEEIKNGRKAEDVLDEIAMLGEAKNTTLRDSENTVKLMTIHASKGLEFSHVYLMGMDAETTPGNTEEFDELEEERRLFYVGITRAINYLAISYPRIKHMHNAYDKPTKASPWLVELAKGLGREIHRYQKPQAQVAPSGP
ncbi:ATP-dependent helicase [Pseudomonas aeruginosa]